MFKDKDLDFFEEEKEQSEKELLFKDALEDDLSLDKDIEDLPI